MEKDTIKYEFLCNGKIDKKESLRLKKKLSKISINFKNELNNITKILGIEKYKILLKACIFNNILPSRIGTSINIFYFQIVLQDELGKDIGNIFIKDKQSSENMDSKIHNATVINNENTCELTLDSIIKRINNITHRELYLDLNANLNFVNKNLFFKNKKTLLFKNLIIKGFYKKIIDDYITNKDLLDLIKKKYSITLDIKIHNEIRWNLKRMYASKLFYSKSRLLKDFDYKEFASALIEINALPESITQDVIKDANNINEILDLAKVLDY